MITYRDKARNILATKEVEIINKPNKLKSMFFFNKITVITAAFNAEKFIEKTINSVIDQSIGFSNIEYIIVNDCSTDNTEQILKKYAKNYKNICVVSLKNNTGTPGTPRNIGIELATGKYVTFLDADDWLDPKGLETLYNILEETGDDYVVGKTIKVDNNGTSIIGEFESVKERRSVSPFDIEHIFYHMGPRARMMKLSLLKEFDIGFPELKFAEDKSFFYDVLLNAKKISTTTKPIYYVNRLDDNPNSLTRVTNVIDKRKADLTVLKYLIQKKLPLEKEKVALNRIFEYDLVRTFNSQTFVKSKEKVEFFAVLDEAVEIANGLKYDFTEEFKEPLYKTAIKLFVENRRDDFVRLFEWYKQDKNKKYVIKGNIAYYEVPFLHDKNRFIEIPMFARALDSYIYGNKYCQTFEIFGRYISSVESILIRDRNSFDNEMVCNVDINGNFGYFEIDLENLSALNNSLFTFFIRYNKYQLVNIKRISSNSIVYGERKIEFYTTKANNLGLSIKNKEKSVNT